MDIFVISETKKKVSGIMQLDGVYKQERSIDKQILEYFCVVSRRERNKIGIVKIKYARRVTGVTRKARIRNYRREQLNIDNIVTKIIEQRQLS